MKARILVIEDEPAINNLLCMNLEVTGYQTVSYLDGNDASEGIAWDHEFQCALVDIMLPGKDGYTLLPELNHYGIPVIFLTARADIASKVKGLKEGAEDYIVKPFEMMEQMCLEEGVKFYHPSPILCTDNAAMIGAAAYYDFIAGKRAGLDLNAVPNLKLGE